MLLKERVSWYSTCVSYDVTDLDAIAYMIVRAGSVHQQGVGCEYNIASYNPPSLLSTSEPFTKSINWKNKIVKDKI